MKNNDDNINNVKNDIQFQLEVGNWNVRDDLKGFDMSKLLGEQPNNKFAIALYNVEGGLNIGSIIRSAVVFGAEKVYIIGKRKYDKRSTVGAHNYIEIQHIEFDESHNAKMLCDEIRSDGFVPIAIEQNGTSLNNVTFKTISYPCFIFGAEKEGLPESIIQYANATFSIPQYGVLRSLNVSVAAGIVMAKFVERFEKPNVVLH